MTTYSLDDVFGYTQDEIVAYLATKGDAYPDFPTQRQAALAYLNHDGLLDAVASGAVTNPRFEAAMRTATSSRQLLALLALPAPPVMRSVVMGAPKSPVQTRMQTPAAKPTSLTANIPGMRMPVPPVLRRAVAPVVVPTGPALKAEIVRVLRRLRDVYAVQHENFRAATFRKAADIIEGYNGPLQAAEIGQLRGIGKSTREIIAEVINKGYSSRLQEEEAAGPDLEVLTLFKQVYGVGDVAATKFYEAGARTIADLAGMELTHAQRLGVEYFNDIQQRIPRAEMDLWVQYLAGVFGMPPNTDLHAGFNWTLAGSYRRLLPDSGDIDIIMCGATIDEVVAVLGVHATLGSGPVKFMGLISLGGQPMRRIDVRRFTPETWIPGLMYNTGSEEFNVLCRNRALDLGMSLNEYRLTGHTGIFHTEAELFAALRLRYIPPEARVANLTIQDLAI